MKSYSYPTEWEVKGLERGIKVLQLEQERLEEELKKVNDQIQEYRRSINALKQEVAT